MDRIRTSTARQNGLTLVELMVVVAISAILLGLVVPNVQVITSRNQVTSDINATSAALRFARFTAVDQLKEVIVCPSADFSACDTSDWDLPKIVFIDRNENGNREANEALLYTTEEISVANNMTAPNRLIVFSPTGTANQSSTLNLCANSNDNKLARQIDINPNGRVKLSRDENGDGIHENKDGDALSCS